MLNPTQSLHKRDLYLNKLIAFQDTEPVKVITGIRRCGKSSLLKLMMQHLREQGVVNEQIIFMNFESMAFGKMTAEDFYEYVRVHLPQDKKAYLFFDEVQHVPEWQNAINSFRVDFACDIYVTGSNAYMLSSDLATYLAGRYVEIKMLPLSFREFLDFFDFVAEKHKNLAGDMVYRITDRAGEVHTGEEVFDAYVKFGGMPGIADVGLDFEKAMILLDGVYSTVVMRDILERERRRGQRQLTDAELLRKIIRFLADNVGNSTSVSSIGNILVNEGLLENGRKFKPAVQTVQAYVAALVESYVFYEIKRFDIKGKEYLRTLSKFYIVDVGLRNFLLGLRDMDTGHVLENIVYFELLRRGYDVAIGKIGNKEIDFIASNADTKLYIQVTETMASEETRKRELAPLQMVDDNYEKIILSRDRSISKSFAGIKLVNVIDWLLEA